LLGRNLCLRISDVSVKDLESAIANLPPRDLARLSRWFEKFMDARWDEQIERDLKSGRLDAVLKRADEHYEAGRCTPL
jgi:hypothetical protein